MAEDAPEHIVLRGALLDASLDGILAFDTECRYTAWNRAMESISGVKRGQVLGRVAFEAFPFLTETGEDRYFREALAGRTAVSEARPYAVPESGRRGFFDGHYSPLYDEAGRVVGGVGIVRDITARKLAEEALRSSEERYRAFIANSSEGIWRFELERPVPARLPEDEQIEFFYRDGYLAECNDAMARMYGFDRAGEVVGARLGDLLVREDPKNKDYLRAFIRSGYRLTDAESVETDREGRRRFFSNNLVGVVEDGMVLRAWGTQRDVTERRRIEEELKATERRFFMFAENLPGLAWIKDAEGRYLYANAAAARAFGVPREAVRGKSDEELFPPETAAEFRDNDRRVLSGEAGLLTVETLKQEDGVHHSIVSKFLIPGPDGAAPMVGGVAVDITERRRAEEALRESEERYRGLLENANDIIYSHDLEGNYLSINRAGSEITGYTREEILGGLNISQVVAPEHLERAREMTRRKLRDPSPTVYEVDILTRDRRRLTLEVSTRISYRDGQPAAVEGVARDVTERKRAEAERELLLAREQAARRQAEEANRLKDEFLATLSHELRTPLTAILGWANMLKSSRLDEDTARHAVETIERNAHAQRRLIEDVLDMSRVVTGKLRIEHVPVDLLDVVQAALDSVRPAAEAKRVALRCSFDPEAGPVTGDPARLQQVVWNLLSNAVKFTPLGGVVKIGVERLPAQIRVTVADTGQGIAPEFLPHVFDRFRQADGSTTRQHGGLGLGLSIVHHLVEAHGGSVHAYSAGEGRGASFTVELPLPAGARQYTLGGGGEAQPSAAGAGNASASGDEAPPALFGVRVLLVEDDPDTLELVKVILEQNGADVTTASTAEGALEALGRTLPDVIISDIGMPGVDGYELMREVRSLGPEAGGGIPAVALTAYAGEADRARAARAGFQLHLAKPVDAGSLVGAVANLTAHAAQGHETE